ncbi:MAG TPA: bifunctional [glutamine synthetase] adenylyltransferase/[glutamine synthetase]-adenylyl-L-tyrosine phosphorylase [Xanthobacteraceae bacterium]|nr:bifunctional [glutamine synthetase] adenylyltransferase/[glutamine synthetase]-adenylyl-L-tyrosine phosphorylase [Xanthobacteraceae bacterium]
MKRPARGKQPQRSLDEGALVRRFAGALPLPSAGARKAISAWLSRIAQKTSGKALKSLVEEDQALARILAGIAETSPYLWDLLQADLSRTTRLLTQDPADELAALLGATRAAAAAASGREPLMRILRRMKAEAALLIALADIGGAWPLARITHALTDVAETALGAAARFLLAEAADRGKLLPVDPQHLETGCGYIVLAMGKMGAHELNFSSDIDLMVFFDPRAPARAANIEPASLYVRLTRDLVKLLQERTADNYVFRVDLRLRPDPSSTQIAISREAALEYYEGRGQNWERAALIKARPCAGDLAAGEQLLHDLSPFVWRKYLDYATVADVHAMKQQIHAYRGHGEIAVEGHNIKLGRGGIREIEFFVQTQQLIAGGRHAELRGRETVATLGALAVGGWIDAATRDELTAAYEFLRRVEHRLQMIADEQTHTLPADSAALDQFARFLGFPGRDDFAETLLGHLRAVERHYVRLFEGAREALARQQNLSFATPEGERDTLDRLAQMGFRQPREVAGAVYRWRDAAYRALRGEQARANLIELVPVIIDQFARAESPDTALVAFDRFLAGLHAGGRFLSLLRQHPDVIRFIALILGTAPRLAEILAQHPHVIDPLIDPRFFGLLPDEGRLEAELARALAETRSYEEMLDAIRRFGQEHMFLIGARILSGSVSAEQAGEVFARLADVLIRALRARVVDDFAAIHGRLPGEQTAILALGRLGAREMTATSDLDLIVIYDFDAEHPNSDGKRSLYGAQYFARLTQRLISALTVRTNYGVLYPVDMRLRPSGRSGPLATQIDGFISYQQREAWTWEHMALTRARIVCGPPTFSARIEAAIREVLCRTRDARAIAEDVLEMRAAIAKEKGDADPWDLKYAAGALVDIEFIAQYLQLAHAGATPEILDTSTARVLEKAARLGVLAPEDASVLRPAVRLYHDLTQILRLCLSGPFDPATASVGVLGLLARAADLPDFPALQAHVEETQRQVRECFVRILGKAP